MIRIRRAADRGHADHGWLDSRHTFSFASYHDPAHMGFGDLRVINEDRVQPGKGFGTHPHRDMEIVSYVLDGALQHRDSMGTGSVIRPGELQLMSAGTGVTHSEFNASDSEPVHFLQIWILPARLGTEPRYEQRAFPPESRRGTLRLLASPDGADGSLTIGQDARIFGALIDGAEAVTWTPPPERRGWVQVARGQVDLDGHTLQAGDGAAFAELERIGLSGGRDAEILLFDLA
jgi:redox-sensitive bicupin YhaK (pirin superfamily)